MKIRNSFVTNSSSSSFVIQLNDDMTIDMFKEAINSYLETEETINFTKDTYDDIFCEPVVITEDMIEHEKEMLAPYTNDDFFEPMLLDTDKGMLLVEEIYENNCGPKLCDFIKSITKQARVYYNN